MKKIATGLIGIMATAAAIVSPHLWPAPQVSAAPAPRLWRGPGSGISGMAISPDGTRLATCALDGTVRFWDTADGRTVRIVRAPDAELYAVAFGRDGRSILTTGDKATVNVFDAISGKHLRNYRGITGWSADLTLSPDGRKAAAWGQDGRILIWDLTSQESARILAGEPGKWGMALAWSPDGRILAAGRATISLWDVEKGIRTISLSGHTDFVRSLAFSPDGSLLASTGLDKTVRVWDVAEGRQRFMLEPEGFVHLSTKGPVVEPIRVPLLAVRFSPDGKTIATAGADRMVRLWDAGTGEFIRSFQGHDMTITTLVFAPDGRALYSAGLDKTVRAWPLF